jgi:DNA-directed RNA polymerase specialized sigma24 family protein
MNPDFKDSSQFAATRWTLVARAGEDSGEGRVALSELCEVYYGPIVKFLRCEGRSEDDARELAHAFFARVLEGGFLSGADPQRGRFRSYLLTALRHYLGDLRKRDFALKRGGRAEHVVLDARVHAPAILDEETLFDREWAYTLLARALHAVGEELREAGKATQFEILKPWIVGDAPGREVAATKLGMSDGALKVAIHRLRQRFREAMRIEIAQTVSSASEAADELRHFIEVLSRRS